MIIVQDSEDGGWHWLSKERKEYNEFESYCLLIGLSISYTPDEYGISSFPFALGVLIPEYYNLQLLHEEEQALIEFAKIKDDKIELYSFRYGNNNDSQGASIHPYEPADGDRMFGQDP